MKSLQIMSVTIFFKYVKWISTISILVLGLSSVMVRAESAQNYFTPEESGELASISADATSTKPEVKQAARNKTKALFKKVGGETGVKNLILRSNNDSTLFGVLSKDEKKAVTAYSIAFDTTTNTTVETNQNSRRGLEESDRNYGPYCNSYTSNVVGRNSIGNWLYKYSQQTYYCYNGSNLTTAYRQNRWAEVYVPGWQFTGHAGSWERGGANQWEFVAWTQGNFQLCIAGWGIGCVQYQYPWVEQRIYGNGNGYSNGG